MSDLFCDLFSEQTQIKDEEVTISSTVEKEGVPRNGKRVFQETNTKFPIRLSGPTLGT